MKNGIVVVLNILPGKRRVPTWRMHMYRGVLVVVICAGVLVPDTACQGVTIG